ncbi:MAG: YceI family protein [Verrucomicrobiota bacterium]
MKTITTQELEGALNQSPPPTLIDVRLNDDFLAAHIPTAVNNCVFEVAFLERMNEITSDKKSPLCVYGAAHTSLESQMAAEKLAAGGFTSVTNYEDGITAWMAAGLDTEGAQEPPATPSVPDGTFPVDLKESRVEWLGRNLVNKHWGHVSLKSGTLSFADEHLAAGDFILDMTSIACDDLKSDPYHDLLVHHLESDDFFDVKNYPEARFVINEGKPFSDASAGSQNLHISGILTLKGITAPVSFTASAGLTSDGKPAAQAAFSIDRTIWNIRYGSGKFFHRLADHLVNDDIELQLRIVADHSF